MSRSSTSCLEPDFSYLVTPCGPISHGRRRRNSCCKRRCCCEMPQRGPDVASASLCTTNHHVHALLYMHGDIGFYIKCHIAAYDISIYIYIHTMVSLYSRYICILCVHFAHAVQVEPGARPRTAAGASLAHCFRSVLRPLDPRLAAFELPDLWMADIVVDPQANKYM